MKRIIKTTIFAAAIVFTPLASFAATMKADISGLVCAFCAQSLEKVFKKQPEVADIKVDLDSKLLTIHFKDGQSMTPEKVNRLVGDAGYTATNFRTEK